MGQDCGPSAPSLFLRSHRLEYMAFVTIVHVQSGILNSGLGVRARPTVVSDSNFLNFIITFEHFKKWSFLFFRTVAKRITMPLW